MMTEKLYYKNAYQKEFTSKILEVIELKGELKGKHGIILKKGFHQATFLPEVATEQGWTKKETLEVLCRKAGLPLGAWKDPSCQFYVYITQDFEEPR